MRSLLSNEMSNGVMPPRADVRLEGSFSGPGHLHAVRRDQISSERYRDTIGSHVVPPADYFAFYFSFRST